MLSTEQKLNNNNLSSMVDALKVQNPQALQMDNDTAQKEQVSDVTEIGQAEVTF